MTIHKEVLHKPIWLDREVKYATASSRYVSFDNVSRSGSSNVRSSGQSGVHLGQLMSDIGNEACASDR